LETLIADRRTRGDVFPASYIIAETPARSASSRFISDSRVNNQAHLTEAAFRSRLKFPNDDFAADLNLRITDQQSRRAPHRGLITYESPKTDSRDVGNVGKSEGLGYFDPSSIRDDAEHHDLVFLPRVPSFRPDALHAAPLLLSRRVTRSAILEDDLGREKERRRERDGCRVKGGTTKGRDDEATRGSATLEQYAGGRIDR